MDILIFLPITIVTIGFAAIVAIEFFSKKDMDKFYKTQNDFYESMKKLDEAIDRVVRIRKRRSSIFDRVASLDNNHIKYDKELVDKYITDAHNPELPIDDREKAIDGLCDYIDTIYFYNK